MEEQLIRKIKGGLIGIKMKTKQPKDVAVLLNKLKLVNKLMYEDLLNDYKQTLKSINF
jgi:hypothetical protein